MRVFFSREKYPHYHFLYTWEIKDDPAYDYVRLIREAKNWQKLTKNKALLASPINAATKPIVNPTVRPMRPAGWWIMR